MTSVATQTVLRLDHVSKTYGEGESSVEAVHDVSMDLDAGKFIFLMGPSGSGKTTLLMLMGCLLRPTAGSVHIFDEEVSSMAEARLPRVRRNRIGYIFQGFNLFPALTALENVEATLNLKGYRGEEGRAEARNLLARVGLANRMHHLPEDLSGGEKQRVAVARALAGNPPIILADEPTGHARLQNRPADFRNSSRPRARGRTAGVHGQPRFQNHRAGRRDFQYRRRSAGKVDSRQ